MTVRDLPRRAAPLRLPLLAVILAATDMALGFVYLLEPRARTLSPALTAARDLFPLWAWGALILAAGFVAVVGIGVERHPTIAMSVGGGWHMFFTLGLIWSAWHDSTAGLAGCVIFASFTTLHFLAARQR